MRPVPLAFFALIGGLPLGQAAWELARDEPVQALEVFGPLEASRLRRFEDRLRSASLVHRVLAPVYQLALTTLLRRGNERSVLGDDSWLYFEDDLELCSAPALEPGRAEAYAAVVAGFRDQLAERGVRLLFVPVPAKTMVDPRHLSAWTRDVGLLVPTSVRRFLDALDEHAVHTVDLATIYRELRASGAQDLYLARDTHWSPATMQAVAAAVAREAARLLDAPAGRPVEWETRAERSAGPGDLVGMLRYPPGATPFPALQVDVSAVVDAGSGAPFAPDPTARVLLLGDSFTRVFSDAALGLGTDAGFAQHLARGLGAPLDVIALAGGSIRGVREALARREAGLGSAHLVIWQVSLRDLCADPDAWRHVDLPERAPDPEPPPPAGDLVLTAEVVEVSRVPEDFDYELCLAVYEYRVIEVHSGTWPKGPLWVAHLAMRDFQATAGNGYEVGDRHVFALENIDDHYDLEATSWVDDTDVGRDIWFATEMRE